MTDSATTTRVTGLQTRPFAYASKGMAAHQIARIGQATDGVVVFSKPGSRKLIEVRRLHSTLPVAIDPGVYEDRDLPPESLFGLHGEWLGIQCDHRVVAYLSPSEYVPASDTRQLEEVLQDGQRFCAASRALGHSAPAFIVVPAHRDWLTDDVETFAGLLAAAKERIALIPADRNDPLATKPAVHGLAYVLSRVTNVALLRTDLAALGAFAHGAILSGIGTGTGVRHLVPPAEKPGGNWDDRTPSVLVEPLLRYRKGSWLGQLEDDGGMLDCGCEVCGGLSLRRFDDPALHDEAQLHSVLIWSALAAMIEAAEPASRPKLWAAMCNGAAYRHEELADRTGVPMPPPAYLQAWADLG